MHALIIEPDGMIALMIEDVLRELGYNSLDHVATTEDGADAVESRCPDLIVCDLLLGAENQVNAMRAICSDRVIPVVFLTAVLWKPIECTPGEALIRKPFQDQILKEAVVEVTRLV